MARPGYAETTRTACSTTVCARKRCKLAAEPVGPPHAAQDRRAAELPAPGGGRRVVAPRRRDGGRQRGSLRRVEIPRWDSEVVLRGGLRAQQARPELDRVEVELEDPPLAQAAFHPPRKPRFPELAPERPLSGKEEGFRELLGDRGGATQAATRLARLDGLGHGGGGHRARGGAGGG